MTLCRITTLSVCALLCGIQCLFAQDSPHPCRECPFPGARTKRDTVMDVVMRDQTILRNCISAKRDFADVRGKHEQMIRLTLQSAGGCTDTIVPAVNVVSFTMGNLGLGGQSVSVQVRPARELYSDNSVSSIPSSFIEVTPVGAYGGSDTSSRKVGFGSIYYGAEALIAPLGSFLGDRVALAVGGGLIMERGRMRFPLMGQLRWTFIGAARSTSTASFDPDSCKFGTSRDTARKIPPHFIETAVGGETDSSVFFTQQSTVIQDRFRPFLFAEGGIIFNGSFDGAGPDPSINSSDYGQYMLGGGIGMPLWDWATVSLSYRYLRLNLRTTCPTCPPPVNGSASDYFILNTNTVHSVLLKFGWRAQW